MLAGMPIMIVEDDTLIALGLSLAVEDCEGVVVGPVATAAEALSLLDGQTIGAALLDANLADRDSTPVALALLERAIPFIFHTGTGLPAELRDALPAICVVRKPAHPDIVVAQLSHCIRSR